MTTDKHVDPAAAVAAPAADESEGDVPEGAVRFELDAAAIEEALAAPSLEVCWLHTSILERGEAFLLHRCVLCL